MTALRLRGTTRTIPATPEAEVELTLNHEWTTYKLYRGDVYTTTSRRGPPKARLTSRRLTTPWSALELVRRPDGDAISMGHAGDDPPP